MGVSLVFTCRRVRNCYLEVDICDHVIPQQSFLFFLRNLEDRLELFGEMLTDLVGCLGSLLVLVEYWRGCLHDRASITCRSLDAMAPLTSGFTRLSGGFQLGMASVCFDSIGMWLRDTLAHWTKFGKARWGGLVERGTLTRRSHAGVRVAHWSLWELIQLIGMELICYLLVGWNKYG